MGSTRVGQETESEQGENTTTGFIVYSVHKAGQARGDWLVRIMSSADCGLGVVSGPLVPGSGVVQGRGIWVQWVRAG